MLHLVLWVCRAGDIGENSFAARLASAFHNKGIDTIVVASIAPMDRFNGTYYPEEKSERCIRFRNDDAMAEQVRIFKHDQRGLVIYKPKWQIYFGENGVQIAAGQDITFYELLSFAEKQSTHVRDTTGSRLFLNKSSQLLPSEHSKTSSNAHTLSNDGQFKTGLEVSLGGNERQTASPIANGNKQLDIFRNFVELTKKLLNNREVNLDAIDANESERAILNKFTEIFNREYSLNFTGRNEVTSLKKMLSENVASGTTPQIVKFLAHLGDCDSQALIIEIEQLIPYLENIIEKTNNRKSKPLKTSLSSEALNHKLDITPLEQSLHRLENVLMILVNIKEQAFDIKLDLENLNLDPQERALCGMFLRYFDGKYKSLLTSGLFKSFGDKNKRLENMRNILLEMETQSLNFFLKMFEYHFGKKPLLIVLAKLDLVIECDELEVKQIAETGDTLPPTNASATDNSPSAQPVEEQRNDDDDAKLEKHQQVTATKIPAAATNQLSGVEHLSLEAHNQVSDISPLMIRLENVLKLLVNIKEQVIKLDLDCLNLAKSERTLCELFLHYCFDGKGNSFLTLNLFKSFEDKDKRLEHMRKCLLAMEAQSLNYFLTTVEYLCVKKPLLIVLAKLDLLIKSDDASEIVASATATESDNSVKGRAVEEEKNNVEDDDKLEKHQQVVSTKIPVVATNSLKGEDDHSSSSSTKQVTPLVKLAIKGIDSYSSKSREGETSLWGFFGKMFDVTRGQYRADFYKRALNNKDYSEFERVLILYALLASHDGLTLQKEVAESIRTDKRFGEDVPEAREQVKGMLLGLLGNSNRDVNKAISEVVSIANSSSEAQPLPKTIWEAKNGNT